MTEKKPKYNFKDVLRKDYSLRSEAEQGLYWGDQEVPEYHEFAVLAVALNTGVKAGWSKKKFDAFLHDAMKDNYGQIFHAVDKYFKIANWPF